VRGRFAAALAGAVAARGLTLERLAYRLRAAGSEVSIAALSSWQTGRTLPTTQRSLAALAQLERLLGQAPGSLERLVAHDRAQRLALAPDIDVGTATLPQDLVIAARRRWGLPPVTGLLAHEIHDMVSLRGDGSASVETRLVLQCVADGTDRWVAGLQTLPEVLDHAEIRAEVGCALGRTEVDRDRAVVLVEVLFPAPLAAGDMHFIVLRTVTGPRPDRQIVIERAVLPRCGQVALIVALAADVGPVSVRCGHREGYDATARPAVTRRLPVHEGSAVYLRDHPPAGIHTITIRRAEPT
jgi:transcriptional regulator with XRE-family HTH domain